MIGKTVRGHSLAFSYITIVSLCTLTCLSAGLRTGVEHFFAFYGVVLLVALNATAVGICYCILTVLFV